MSRNSSGMDERLAVADLIVKTGLLDLQEKSNAAYQMVWSIDKFPQLMENFTMDEALPKQKLPIQLPGQDWKAVLTMQCIPRYKDFEDEYYLVVLKAWLNIENSRSDQLLAALSFGLLKREGTELSVCSVTTRPGSEHKISVRQRALMNEADSMLPDGRLIIFAKVTFFAWNEVVVGGHDASLMQQKLMMKQSSGEKGQVFMLDSFVEIPGEGDALELPVLSNQCSGAGPFLSASAPTPAPSFQKFRLQL
jgi:hypothetical protein